MMTHVHIKGPLLSISGYGVHARQVFRWAHEQGFYITTDITRWGNTPWYTNRNECDGLVDEIMEASSPLKVKPDVSFQIMLPSEWNPTLAKRNFGVTAVVEADKCSDSWIHACRKMDHVIVPSEFSKRCLVNSGLKSKKVSVISEAFIDAIDKDVKKLPLSFETDDNYLMFGQVSGDYETDRKNTAMGLALFCRTFANDPTKGLIVKTNSGNNSTVDREKSRKFLKSVVEQVRKGPYPKIYFLHGYLNDAEVASLYVHPKIKGLISFTHGEGFGLPLLEAAASGLPVCATDWSAHTEFLNLGNWTKIKSELTVIPEKKVDNVCWVRGSKWASPVQAAVSETLHQFDKVKRSDVKELQNKVKSKYCWSSVSKQYDQFWRKWS